MKTIDNDDIASRLDWMTAPETPAAETRSFENPNQAVSPAMLDSIWGYGPTRSGVQINEQTAMTYLAVYAAVKILSESVGQLPLVVYQGDEDEGVRTRAREHPAYHLLLRAPNDESNPITFKESMQANLSLWGNAYARILEDGAGRPKQLIPLRSDRTHAERVAGQLRYTVDGGGGTFAPEEIIHIPGLSLNGLTGLSPIAYAREAIAMGKAAEIFGATFYGNGAQLGGVLEVPGVLKPEQRTNLRESWNATHSGVGNAHGTAILEAGTKYTRTSIPPDEAQFLESRKFQVIEVARMYRIPPHMLMELDRATNNNIEHQSLEFLIYTLGPWLVKWEEEFTRKLCGNDVDYHIRFDVRRLIRADMGARQSYFATARNWGWMSRNDVRREEGMPPIKDGDDYLLPVNMAVLGAVPVVPPPDNEDVPDDVSPDIAARAEAATRDVMADAIARMLRKESNARSRGKADEAFYTDHRGHVREALYPAARSFLTMTGRDLTPENGAAICEVLRLASEVRHETIPDPVHTLADAEAADISRQIVLAVTRFSHE